MNDSRILLVEDEEMSRDLVMGILKDRGYAVTACENGEAALGAYQMRPFPLVITDIDMPVMDGNELIRQIKGIDENQVIIVLTIHEETKIVIDIMRNGVFDYLIKPPVANDLLCKVERAMEVAELKRMKRVLEAEKTVRLENQLQWFTWNEKIIQRDYDRVDQTLFYSLHSSFNQGAGFGALLTLISLISETAEKVDDNYLIDSLLFDLINKNAQMAERTLNVFSDINRIINNDLNMERSNVADVCTMLRIIVREHAELASKKKQELMLSELKPGFEKFEVMIDHDYMAKAASELLVNALKFSDSNSTIYLLIDMRGNDSLAISFISKPTKTEKGIEGIPIEYENLVFEPFFRLTGATFEQYETLDYGLGLTVVEKIITKHGGRITVSNILDYTDISREPIVKVNFSLSLPLIKD
ncbi:MAG TPA: response regulator [Spirochaetota bacterium]|nr:response regulator [Spirochaetota bacterium]HNT12764.1 response regulator [Spirochaetota bacterium]